MIYNNKYNLNCHECFNKLRKQTNVTICDYCNYKIFHPIRKRQLHYMSWTNLFGIPLIQVTYGNNLQISCFKVEDGNLRPYFFSKDIKVFEKYYFFKLKKDIKNYIDFFNKTHFNLL